MVTIEAQPDAGTPEPKEAYFHVSANWKTWSGNVGGWSGNVRASDIDAAMEKVRATLERRRRRTGFRSPDMSASAYPAGYVPHLDM